MMYAINSPHKEKMIHPKYMTDNSVTYIMLDYMTRGMDVTVYNVEEGGGMV